MSIHVYFNVKCGSTTCTFTYVFVQTEAYNIDINYV